jgi:hypothetical protein
MACLPYVDPESFSGDGDVLEAWMNDETLPSGTATGSVPVPVERPPLPATEDPQAIVSFRSRQYPRGPDEGRDTEIEKPAHPDRTARSQWLTRRRG